MDEKKYKKKRLVTLKDVRVYLSWLVNSTACGETDPNLAGKLGFLLNVLRGVIADSTLEERISKLEAELEKEPQPGRRKRNK